MLTGNLSRNKAILRALNFTNCCYTYKCYPYQTKFFREEEYSLLFDIHKTQLVVFQSKSIVDTSQSPSGAIWWSQPVSNSSACDCEVAKEIDDHDWESDGSFSGEIHRRKIRSHTYKMLHMDIKRVSSEYQSWLCKQFIMQTFQRS